MNLPSRTAILSIQAVLIVSAIALLGGCAADAFMTPEQRAMKEATDKSLGYDPESKREAKIKYDAGEKVKAIFADSDAHPEKYQLEITKEEEAVLSSAVSCESYVSNCMNGERGKLQQVGIAYHAMLLCNNEKLADSDCTDPDINILYYRMLNTAQKQDFISHLMEYYAQAKAETVKAENEHMAELKQTFAQEFKGQYQAVKITTHYFEQEDPNFPQIDPLMGLGNIEQSPTIQSKEDCVVTLKQSIKKRWWSGLIHGSKQLSDNTVVAPIGADNMLVQEKYICVPVVENPEVRSIISNYENEIRANEMGLGKNAAINELVPPIPGLQN